MEPTTGGTQPPAPLPLAEHANVSFVLPRLAVGGDLAYDARLGRRQLEDLLRLGITHVADVRLEWSDAELFAERAPHVAYLDHGVDDAGQVVPPEWFEPAVTWALDALADPDAVVLTHCHMGINRGPSLGFAVMLALGWDPVDALTTIRTARPIAAVAYAEDALHWHHQRTGAPPEQVEDDRARLAQWRRDNEIDVSSVVRRIRESGPELRPFD